jgi:hypothetical protein
MDARELHETFLKKIDDWLFAPLEQRATRQQVAQAKYLLQEEYHVWKKATPVAHLRAAEQHQCVPDVYDQCFDRLHLLELTLRPAVAFPLEDAQRVPAAFPPSPPPPPQIAGIFLGELDDP